jgi:gliding motility-associated-like protein
MTGKTFILFTSILIVLCACRKEHISNDICDCASSKSTIVIDTITLTIPNLITPNSDGFNDAWQIKNIDKFPDCKIKVMRPGVFGGIVFETTGASQIWFGDKKNSKSLKEGKYKYEITINGQTYTGFVCVFGLDSKPESNDCLKSCVVSNQGDPYTD